MRIVIGTAVVKDDKILLVQEAQKKCRGQWNLPAGHLDDNEYIFDAAIRETKEETGYDVKLTNLIGIFSGNTERPHFMIFGAEVTGGGMKFDPEEIMDAKWVPIDELQNYNLRMPKLVNDEVIKSIKGSKTFPLNTVKEY